MGLLDNLRRHNADALHRFLWSNHLAYAMSYEIAQRFETRDLNSSRRILFENITGHLRSRGLDPRRKIGSVFEVGCSLGYLLRHLEVDGTSARKMRVGTFVVVPSALETGIVWNGSVTD
jgi:hypothetical protein